jgi:hypothetical protein
MSDARTGAPSSAMPSASSPVVPRRVLPRGIGIVAVILAVAIIVAVTPELRARTLALIPGPQATPSTSLLPTIPVHGPVRTYPTAVPGPHVRWQPTAPLPSTLTYGIGSNFAIAPSDGRIAYLCAVSLPPQGNPTPSGETSQFWVTHDRGAHWAPVRAISAQSNATSCDAEIDTLDPSLVVLASSHENLTPATPGLVDSLPNQTVNEATFDGGITWQRLAGNQQLRELTTVHGVTFALRATQPGQASSAPITYGLAMSRDQLRTWTPIDTAIRAASPREQVVDYTLDPTTGALLVVTSDTNGSRFRLWSSTDTGQHWRELPLPAGGGTGFMQLLLPSPAGDAPRRVCGVPAADNGTSVVCCADGGTTWTPPIAFLAEEDILDAFATDGALLMTGPGSDAQGNGVGTVLYRLPAGATTWQTLGPAPEAIVVRVSGPGTGVLWALPFNPPASDAQEQLFTADYP